MAIKPEGGKGCDSLTHGGTVIGCKSISQIFPDKVSPFPALSMPICRGPSELGSYNWDLFC